MLDRTAKRLIPLRHAEHDYLTSDEHLDERLVDLRFDEDGGMLV